MLDKPAQPPRPSLAPAPDEGEHFAFVLALSAPAGAPLAPGRDDEHELFHGLLAEASQQDLVALRHLITCRLCRRLARVVLVEIPARELLVRAGAAAGAHGAASLGSIAAEDTHANPFPTP